jgi:transcriptional regulator with XRE-family HTH domain
MHSIYERIELLIRLKKMTKKRFCEQLGISTGNLGDWKRGKSTPSTNKVVEIAAFFDVSLDWLMLGKEHHGVTTLRESSEALGGYSVSSKEAVADSTLTAEEEIFIREYIAFTQYRKQQDKKQY